MKRSIESKLIRLKVLCVVLIFFCSVINSTAAVIGIGDVSPADPATWTLNTTGYIGLSSMGTVNVDDGSNLLSGYAVLGYNLGSTGMVKVMGPGSKWTNSGSIDIGDSDSSSGILIIEAGGQVSDISGNLGLTRASIGTAKVAGTGSTWLNSGALSVGCSGSGSLHIESGGQVSCNGATVGVFNNSTGMVTVSGHDSTLYSSLSIFVGKSGNGTLVIKDQGRVIDTSGYIGSNSTGKATVIGIGSTWTNSNGLALGFQSGNGTLNIIGGGIVTANSLGIEPHSLLTIDVFTGSRLILNGSGIISNYGKIRILASASPMENAAYLPISFSTSWGSSTYQAVGGKWDSVNHLFTVSRVHAGESGIGITIDRLNTQRVLIKDQPSNWKIGASFAATASSSPLTFTATAINDGILDKMKGILGAGDVLLGGWNLSASGYTAGDPVYLSLGDGFGGYADDAMQVWSYDGTEWSKISPDDLTYDGTYASFMTTSLGTFAITVPEPSTIALLGMSAFGLFAWTWRRFRVVV